jgi:hypothetical protein
MLPNNLRGNLKNKSKTRKAIQRYIFINYLDFTRKHDAGRRIHDCIKLTEIQTINIILPSQAR